MTDAVYPTEPTLEAAAWWTRGKAAIVDALIFLGSRQVIENGLASFDHTGGPTRTEKGADLTAH